MKPTHDRSATEGQHGFVGGIPPGGARVYYVFQRDMGPRMRDEWMGWLSAEERVRQARYQRESDRDLYLMAHGMLRRVLAQHTGLSPDALRFETNRFGRPELSDDAAGRSIRFNLTHTPGLAACAVAADRAVGVDAENLDREIDLRSVSARVFSAGRNSRPRQTHRPRRDGAILPALDTEGGLRQSSGDGVLTAAAPDYHAADGE